MNKLIAIGVSSLLAISVNAQVKYSIKGIVPAGYAAKMAVLGYPDKNVYKSDTANINDGIFEFKGAVSRPQLAQLDLIIPRPADSGRRKQSSDEEADIGMKNMALFYMDGIVTITFDTAGIAKVTGGGKEQKIFLEYVTSATEKNKTDNDINFFQENIASYIKKYPNSYVSLDLLEVFAGVIQPKVFEPMFNSLSKKMQNTKKAKEWKKKLQIAKRFDIGQPSIDFTLNNTEGKPISLASYKGKYVLLDFWASWCGPCRAGHPGLINIYGKYKGKNFEILAVSLDDEKDLWLKAIETDKLPWTQIGDLKGAESDVAKMYHITNIPQNLLIDPNGIIVGRNLQGESLEAKLSELFK